jgi:hypothetical protein
MLVHGGRCGWARVVGFAAALGILGSLGTACGSRTSMLDSDAYEGSRDGVGAPGGTGGNNSNGGSPSRAGSGSTTPAGGFAGVDTTLALAPCQQYCPGYGTQCKARLEGRECLSTCQGELNGYGTSCQMLGISALRCLTPFFSASGGDCNAAVNRALIRCGMIVATFESCKQSVSAATPSSKPSNPLSSCLRSGGGDSTSCVASFDCNEGDYFTYCSLSPTSMLLDCGCVHSNGQMTSGFIAPSGDVCLDAAALCR